MIRFAFLGLGLAGIYALAGQGLILVYKGSGVVNFAQGAFAAVGAFAFFELHDVHGLPVVAALVLTLVLCGAVGAFVHLMVMRPLRHSPPLTRVIATLGVMTALQLLGDIIWGAQINIVSSLLPTRPVSLISGAPVGENTYIILGIAFAVSGVLWFAYRYTRFGALTTAVAENERTAQLTGHSPDVIAVINWMLGAMLAGAAGILIAPISGLNTDTLVLLVIPALATCVVANFNSFVWAFVASLVIGITQSEFTNYVSATGWSDCVPFLMVIVVLVVRGRPLPLRSHVNELLPEIGSGVVKRPRLVFGTLVAVAILILSSPGNWNAAFITTIIGAIICVSLVVVTGYAGQLSLAQFAFAGWGAFVATRLAATQGLPFLVAIMIGVVSAVPLGILVGLPALRTRGINLAIVTLGMAFALQSVLFDSVPLTGGLQGTNLKPASLFGWDVDEINHPKSYAIVCLIGLFIAVVVARNIRRGASGRRLVAVRGNERAAASLGINVYGAKLYAFAVSSALAGLGGVLFAYQTNYVDFSQFTIFQSIGVVIFTVIGGVGFLIGAVIAGLSFAGGVATLVFSSLTSSGSIAQWVTLVLAALLIPTLIKFPHGLAAWIVRLKLPEMKFLPGIGRNSTAANKGPTAREDSMVERLAPPRVAYRILSVQRASVRYGGIVALSDVAMEVTPGEVVGLMGPNGAGKTTLIDAITGFTALKSGSIVLDGTRIDGLSARRRARMGIARTFQSLELFDQLSVRENLRMASDSREARTYLTDLVRPKTTKLTLGALSAIEMFELEDDLDRVPSELPYGRRRQVAIARAVATEPSILLLDEPAAGLNENETRELANMVRRLADEWGMGILLIEHDVPMLNQVCDRLVVLDFGVVIATGTPAEIRNDQSVVDAYLGPASEPGEVVGHAI